MQEVVYFLHGIDVSGFRNIIFGGMLVIMMVSDRRD